MEKRTQNYNLEEIIERMDKKKLTFDYPIQAFLFEVKLLWKFKE